MNKKESQNIDGFFFADSTACFREVLSSTDMTVSGKI